MKKLKQNKDEYQDDVLDLCRKILKGVQLSEVNKFDKLTGQDRINFLKYCSQVASDPLFLEIFSALYWPSIVYAGTKAEDYDIVTFNRATANGVSLVQNFFEKYARQYVEEIENKTRDFDKQKSFESVADLDVDAFFKS